MSQFPYNTTSDEYSYPPFKKGINSFYTDNLNSCMSPYGPVSNINCPTSNPYCQCPTKIAELQPLEEEPTDASLAELKNKTSECNLIKGKLSLDWIGIDYSNPHADYNCTNCIGVSGGLGFTGVDKVTEDWSPYFDVTVDTGTSSSTAEQLVAAPTTDVKYYYNYDKRKLFGSDGITTTFPPQSSEIVDTTVDCGDNSLIGPYFKYYKEYSKTAATFWNTPPKTPLYRKAQTALMTTQRIKILVHGNLAVRPGKMVYIDYYNFGGRWMVYKVQRVITAQKHSMYLYLMRDGVA
jgi:hypothetical protein